jgi:hypothetical protein
MLTAVLRGDPQFTSFEIVTQINRAGRDARAPANWRGIVPVPDAGGLGRRSGSVTRRLMTSPAQRSEPGATRLRSAGSTNIAIAPTAKMRPENSLIIPDHKRVVIGRMSRRRWAPERSNRSCGPTISHLVMGISGSL